MNRPSLSHCLPLALFFLFGCEQKVLHNQSAPMTHLETDRALPAPFNADDEREISAPALSDRSYTRFEKERPDLTGGAFTSTLGASDDVVRAMALSSDGSKLFIAGRVASAGTGNDFLIGKLDAAGVFDTTFSADGWATTDFGSNRDEVAHAVAWQTDGKVLVGGRANNGTNFDFAIVRYRSDGSADTSFGSSGIKTHTIGSKGEFIRGLYFQTNGIILAGGYSDNGSDYDFAVTRYLNGGALDTTYGTGGAVTVDILTGRDDCATSAVVMSDGRLVAGGASYNASNNWDVAIMRLNTDGSADTTFSSDGKLTTTVGSGDDILWAVTLDASEKIVGAGESSNGSNQDFLAMRYKTDGSIDTLFNTTGSVTNSIGSGNDIARGVAIDVISQKIVLAGTATGSSSDFGVFRLLTDGTRDDNFSNAGSWTQTFASAEDSGLSVAIARDTGRVYAGGRVHNGSDYDIGLMRMTARDWIQRAYIKAQNANANDVFASSVAIGPATVAIGATGEDADATAITNGSTASTNNDFGNSGAVYVYARSGTVWAQQAYVKASNNSANDYFGFSVNLSGDSLIVGAPNEDSNQATITNGATASGDDSKANSGAAYVYLRTGTTWAQQAYLKAANVDSGDQFGFTVAIDSNTAVVGAPYERSNSGAIINGNTASTNNSWSNPGAAYVFLRSGTEWTQQAYLKAQNAGSLDEFGHSVSISGNTIVVGAYLEDSNVVTILNGSVGSTNNAKSNSGAAYVFTRAGTEWTQQAYLKPSNADASDQFGWNVGISGDTAIVSATGEDANISTITNGATASTNNDLGSSGAVYVFSRSGTEWSQQAYLKPTNPRDYDAFGYAAAISGDSIVVTANQEDSPQTTISNGTVASTDGSAAKAGAAWVFLRSGTVWSQQAYLKAANAQAGDYFGNSAAISGQSVIVGARIEDSNTTAIVNGSTASANNAGTDSGAGYVFVW